MKIRKLLLVCLILTFFAGCSELSGSVTEFGHNYDIYFESGLSEIAGIGGNTEVVRPVGMGPLGCGNTATTVAIDVAENMFLAATSYRYVEGECVDDTRFEYGQIEKLDENGEWIFYDELRYNIASGLMDGEPPFITVGLTSELPIFLPGHIPGTYRVTYYYRDCVSAERHSYETGETLYSVYHTVSVPDATSNRFDIVRAIAEKTTHNEMYNGVVWVSLRANEGAPPWLCTDATLEVLTNGGEYSIVEGVDGWPAVFIAPEEGFYRELIDSSEDSVSTANYPSIRIHLPDYSSDYRLTLGFTEKPDGTGERYTLQLRLKFSEE